MLLVICIEGESQNELGLVIQEQLALLFSHAFIPNTAFVDPQRAFFCLTTIFPDVAFAKDYTSEVDSKMKRLEKYMSSLLWSLSLILVQDQIALQF